MNSILTDDFRQQIIDAEQCASQSLRRLHAALGGVMLSTTPINEMAHDHLITVDDEATRIYQAHAALIQSLRDMAALAQSFQQQRNQVLGELQSAAEQLVNVQNDTATTVYLRMRDNIAETFYCSEETAERLMHALWDKSADVDDELTEILDRIADTLSDLE